MTRYFFDVNTKTSIQYDYCGRHFHSLDQAREQAELIAIDLGYSQGDAPLGMEVEVRDAIGRQLFAVLVPLTGLRAA